MALRAVDVRSPDPVGDGLGSLRGGGSEGVGRLSPDEIGGGRTEAGAPSLWLVLWTMVGGYLAAGGAGAINCALDSDIDINMGRTSRRPIPSGRIPAWHALALGIALGVAAFAILVVFVNLAAALLSLAGYLYYVLIYTRWLKRTTPQNIVIGGGAGAFPPLVGWAAAGLGIGLRGSS